MIELKTGMTNQLESLTFTTAEMAEACDFPVPIIGLLVDRGFLVPHIKGKRGPGNSHRWNVKQMCGLAFAAGIYSSSQGCRMSWFSELVNDFDRYSWSAVEHGLGIRDDAWSSEAYAKALHPEPLEEWAKGSPVDEHISKEVMDAARRIERVRLAVRKRLGIDGGGGGVGRGAAERSKSTR